MNSKHHILTSSSRKKSLESLELILASINTYTPYSLSKKYTPQEREPFDAMCDRFVRAVEICLKFFRSYELLKEGINSETVRDLLNKMEKLNIISSTSIWMYMRDLRNRIVHDYLPEDLQRIYESITGEYGKELLQLRENIDQLQV